MSNDIAAETMELTNDVPLLSHVLSVSSIRRRLGDEWTETAKRRGIAFASGPSGVGKSILMHQVVVPALRQEAPKASITAFMPDEVTGGFFFSLWRALGRSDEMPSDYEGALLDVFRRELESTERAILVIDGLEQIFSESDEVARRVLAFLWKLADEKLATVIGAFRSPFKSPICKLLLEVVPAGSIFVSIEAPVADERRILATEGVNLASPNLAQSHPEVFKRLVDEITAELNQAPQALPFLTPLLERWRAQEACGDLSVMNWLRSGGLAGEISVHVEEKFNSLKPRLRKQLNPLLRLLVSWTDELAPAPTEVSFVDIEKLGEDAVELTNVLLYERVLFLSGDDVNAARVQIIHPGLFQHWARVKEMLDEERKDLSARRLLDAQALHWDSNGRRAEDQWIEGELLLMAQTLLSKESQGLPRITQEFLQTFQDSEDESSAPLRRLKRMVKPVSMLIVLFALMQGLLKMTDSKVGPESGPIMKASAGEQGFPGRPLVLSEEEGSEELDLNLEPVEREPSARRVKALLAH